MNFFIYKIKIFLLSVFSVTVDILVFIKKILKSIFVDFFYYKIIFKFLLPFYTLYKRFSKDVFTQNNLELNLLGRLFAVLLNKKIVSFVLIFFVTVVVLIDNKTIYSIYDSNLKAQNSVFFTLAGVNGKIPPDVVDNVVLTKKINNKDNFVSKDDINQVTPSDFKIDDPEQLTYFVFDYSSVYSPSIIETEDSEFDSEGPIIDKPKYKQKFYYIVKAGETLSSIAQKFGISKNTILFENKLVQNAIIKQGAKLSILPFTGVGYKVQYGDTLLDLSIKYKVSIDTIKRNNPINSDILRLGQTLLIETNNVPAYTPTNIAVKPKPKPTVSKTDYVNSWKLYPRVSQVSGSDGSLPHRFPYGQCTWYVATRRFVPWAGHAKSWVNNSQKFGYDIGSTPRVGAIVATRENDLYGHVAYVEKVTDTTIVISEMNYKGWGLVNTREININDWRIVGYIY